jgi:hypothetical protein
MFRRRLMRCEGLEPQLALATGDGCPDGRRLESDRLGDGDWRSGY